METFPTNLSEPGAELSWTLKPFEDLSGNEVYEILKLRSEVFVMEQQCLFMDIDDKDKFCHHLMGWADQGLIAYSRIVPAGLSYEFPSIGRIVVSPKGRSYGYGVKLLQQSIQCVENLYEKTVIRIGAQQYLKIFYEKFNFFQSSESYLEDGIEHIEMTRAIVN